METLGYWANHAVTATGAAWTNQANMLDGDADEASVSLNAGVSAELRHYNWDTAIPTGSVVTNIMVEVRCRVSTGTSTLYNKFNAAASYKSASVTTTEGVKTFDGDLTYWDLTEAEALSAVNSTTSSTGWQFYLAQTASATGYVEFVRMTVTYTPPSDAGMLMGSIS